MLSSVRTPLSTRLLKGHETNWRLGSSRMTSMDGSPRRTYFAAVAPPHPPPTTTTRRAVFGAKSPFIAVAHPPPSRPTPSPIPDVRRNSRRPIAFIAVLLSLKRAEPAGRLVPGGGRGPRRHDHDDEDDRSAPPERRGQEHSDPELAGEPGGREAQPGERRGQREARDGDPELELTFAGAPDRAGAAAAGERHADSEQQTAHQPPGARAREHPLRLVLEIGELEDREAERADDQRERRCPRVLGVAAQERLAERAHEAEPRALEDHPEGDAEEQEDPLRGVAGPRVEERRSEEHTSELQSRQ